jgi:hypothetical protein
MWGALSDERIGLSFKLLLVLASAVTLLSESRGTRDHILLSRIRDFLFVASYDSQGWGGGRLHAGANSCIITFGQPRREHLIQGFSFSYPL